MESTDTSLFDPLFWTMLTATLIPFITGIVVRYHASNATKAWIATGLSVIDACLIVWQQASDKGLAVNWKVLIMAIAVAITSQRITYSQVVKPNKIAEKLPEGGLVGRPVVET